MNCDPVNVCIANHTGLDFPKAVFDKTGLIHYTFRLSCSIKTTFTF